MEQHFPNNVLGVVSNSYNTWNICKTSYGSRNDTWNIFHALQLEENAVRVKTATGLVL